MKRVTWFLTGTGFGMGASVWARRKIRSKVDEITPLAVSRAALISLFSLKEKIVSAFEDARAEANMTETTLREQMGLEQRGKSEAS